MYFIRYFIYYSTVLLISPHYIQNLLKSLVGRKLFIFVIHNSPFVYSHLWFLFALVYCYITIYFLKEKILGKWKIYASITFFIFFYIFSIILPSLGYPKDFFEGTLYPQNLFILRALPFFLLGIILREHSKNIIQNPNITNHLCIICIVLGCCSSIIERILFIDSQFYLGSYITCVFIFIYCIKNPSFTIKPLEYCGKYLSMYVYICHIAFILFLRYMTAHGVIQETVLYTWIRPFIVLTATICTSYLLSKLPILTKS